MSYYRKTLRGSLMRDCNPTFDIPRPLRHYDDEMLRLDELITQRYTPEQVNEDYDDLLNGKNIRGTIEYTH